jgi:predicted dehydrogenase
VEIVHSLFHQRWRIPGSEKSLTAEDTNWDEFLSYTPKVPFDARHYREFRLFWPYSTGLFCQWMSHYVDLVNLVLDETPKAAIATGGVYVWKDGRTNPDTAHCLIEYPSGCLFSYHMRLGNSANGRTLTFYGTNGTLDLQAGIAYGEGGGGTVVQQYSESPIPELTIDATQRLPVRNQGGVILKPEPDGDHMADFFQAVRNRSQPKAPVEAGFDHAVATTMAGMSLRNGVRVQYDPTTDTISMGKNGSKLRSEVMPSSCGGCHSSVE